MLKESYEIIENDSTYIINTYENGAIEKILKVEEPIIKEEILKEREPRSSEVQAQILLNTEYLVALSQLNDI